MPALAQASGLTGAVLVVGVVVLEALVLHVVYGAVEWLVGPKLLDALRG